jgi:hypothetical protein
VFFFIGIQAFGQGFYKKKLPIIRSALLALNNPVCFLGPFPSYLASKSAIFDSVNFGGRPGANNILYTVRVLRNVHRILPTPLSVNKRQKSKIGLWGQE